MVSRRRLLSLIVTGSGLLAAACATGSSTTGGSPPSTAPPPVGTSNPAASSSAGASQFSPALQALIQAANNEGMLSVPDVVAADIFSKITAVFNQRFGTNINVQLLPLRSAEVPTRLQQESAAGKVTVDLVHPSSSLVFGLQSQNVDVFDTFDWVGTFGSALPSIQTPADRVPESVKGEALEGQHLVRTIAYNTNLVSATDIPTTWDGLLDPRWQGGKIAIDPQGSSTYQLLTEWDDQRVLDYSTKLAAQAPVWVPSEPNIAQSIARGDALLGITSPANVKDQLDQGLPIAIGRTEFAPGQQQLLFPVKGSPHINAARLYAAWIASEGLQVQSSLGYTTERAWPDSNSWSSQQLSALGIKVDILVDPADVQRADALRTKIAAEYRQLGAGGS